METTTTDEKETFSTQPNTDVNRPGAIESNTDVNCETIKSKILFVCSKCNNYLAEDQFYTQKERRFKICKGCLAAPKRPKKPNGFYRLPQDVQDGIKADYAERKNTVTSIAKKYKVNLPNLVYWIRSNNL
jgi:hypothetical protein